MVRHVLFTSTQLSHFQAHNAQLQSVLYKTQKRPNNPLSEDEKDLEHVEENEDPSDEGEEIPGVEKATPQASGADTSQPGPLPPNTSDPSPQSTNSCSTIQHVLQRMGTSPKKW